MRNRYSRLMLLAVGLLMLLTVQTFAVSPTKEAIKQWIADGVYEQKIQNWNDFKANGGCQPFEHSPLKTLRTNRTALDANTVDTIRVLTILVEFTDWLAEDQNYSATPEEFDSLLFSDRNTDSIFNDNGSMTDFYFENSYGTVYVQGDIVGWLMMPNTYAFYEGGNDGLGGGGAILAGHAVDAADVAGVDFSLYGNGDNFVDGVIIVHAGPGAETGAYGIWSHRSNMTTRFYDGMQISAYTMNPEELGTGISTQGVYSHEWGHALGLPDLYDLNSSSPGNGLDSWCLMASGSWNDNGRVPAQLSAWCKAQLGFVNVTWITSNTKNVEFPRVEDNPVVYGINELEGGGGLEYWLIENRQLVGFDAHLPGAGLCIYHVDDAVAFQNNPARYKVAMEQADGENDLAILGSSDNGDPFPGIKNVREFHDLSTPNSRDNNLATTEVGVWNISNSDSLMTADLDITFSRPWIELSTFDSLEFSDVNGGDGDGIPEAGETIDFTTKVINRMRTVYGGVVSLSTSAPVTFIQNDVNLTSDLATNMNVSHLTPIQFTIPADFESVIAEFTLTVTADSASGSGDQIFSKTINFDQQLGAAQILLVDDDGGDTWEQRLSTDILELRFPKDIWTKSSGSPTGGDLLNYNTVIWQEGSNQNGGELTAADVTALKAFLDGGGNLLLSTMTGASTLQTLDSAFMHDYLHATLAGTNVFGLGLLGNDGTDVGDGIDFRVDGNAPISPFFDIIDPVGSAEESFRLGDDLGFGDFGGAAVAYTGSYRSFFTTYPIEFINEGSANQGFELRDSLINRVLTYFRYSYPYVKTLFAEADDINALVSHTPQFGWNIRDTIASTQAMYELEVGTDLDWTTAEMWATGMVASADTFVTYAGSALVDGTDYFLRVRTNNGTYWSDWYETTFHMNSLPNAPTVSSPSANKITDDMPTLVIINGSDPEGSALSYQFEVYDDVGLTNAVATSSDIPETSDSTSWTLTSPLADLTDHYWRARSFDGAEYGSWSSAEQFTVNNAYTPPTGNLSFGPLAILPCDTTCIIQPIVVNASKPLTEAVIPISIPSGVTVCEVNFDGLTTSAWDLNSVQIDVDSGFVVINLKNSGSMQIPPSPTTVGNLLFTYPASCVASEYIVWDTARFDVPTDQLKFTDTFEVFSPDFTFGQDTTEIIGYTPGDMDGITGVDIGDITFLIDFLFISGNFPCIANSADINSDCSGPDIGDLTALIDFLFISGTPLGCGCIEASPSAEREVNSNIALNSVYENGKTTITIKSSKDLRGLHIELENNSLSSAKNLIADEIDLLVSSSTNYVSVSGRKLDSPVSTLALLDLDGDEIIKSGEYNILELDGEYEIRSANVSDLNHNVWNVSLSNRSTSSNLPASYALDQNYPNPFNPTTQISFALPEEASVKLEIFNTLGQKVTTLIDGEMEAGSHTIVWDGKASAGNSIASGVYFYRLSANDFRESKKMMLLK